MSGAAVAEILGLLGVVASLVKLADLLLGERLKRAIQGGFETLTLYLDEMDPMRWFVALSRPAPALLLSVCAGLLAWIGGPNLIGGALALLLDLWIMSGAALLGLEAPFSLRALAPGFLVAMPLSALAIWKLSPRAVIWLAAHGVARFLVRLVVFYGCSALIFFAFWSAAQASIGLPLFEWGLLVLWPFLFGGFVVNASALLMFTLLLILVPLKVYADAAAAFCWRVVQYSGGAMAALFIVSAASLALGRVLAERDLAPTILTALLCAFYFPSVWAAASIASGSTFKRKGLWIALVLLLPVPGLVVWHGSKGSAEAAV